MKKLSLIMILMVSIFMVGCGSDHTKELEEQMESHAKKYYETFANLTSGEPMTYEVTLGALKEVNKSESILQKDKFDISKFEDAGCKDSTKAIVKVKGDRKIESITVKLNCK